MMFDRSALAEQRAAACAAVPVRRRIFLKTRRMPSKPAIRQVELHRHRAWSTMHPVEDNDKR